jgi:hypothetical protein
MIIFTICVINMKIGSYNWIVIDLKEVQALEVLKVMLCIQTSVVLVYCIVFMYTWSDNQVFRYPKCTPWINSLSWVEM